MFIQKQILKLTKMRSQNIYLLQTCYNMKVYYTKYYLNIKIIFNIFLDNDGSSKKYRNSTCQRRTY